LFDVTLILVTTSLLLHAYKFIGVILSPNSQQYFRSYNESDHGSKSEKGKDFWTSN